jgi:ATP-binding cassette subfamily F protein 3
MSTKSKVAKSGAARAIGPAEIVATSQQSRFHVDTLSTLSKEVGLGSQYLRSHLMLLLGRFEDRYAIFHLLNALAPQLRSQVNISIGMKDILVDGHLRLKSNVCYGFVGRNGQGKSSEHL